MCVKWSDGACGVGDEFKVAGRVRFSVVLSIHGSEEASSLQSSALTIVFVCYPSCYDCHRYTHDAHKGLLLLTLPDDSAD